MSILTERSLTRRYLTALLAPLLVAAFLQVSWPLLESAPVAAFLLAVMFCGWYGGLRPALLSIFVAFLLTDYFFLQPYFSLGPRSPSEALSLAVLVALGVSWSILSELLHKERQRAELNLDSARRAEEARRQSDENYRALFEGSALPMWVYDLETLAFLVVNEAAVRHYGYSREEFQTMTMVDIRPPEEVPAFRAALAQAAAGSIPVVNSWRHKKKDGSVIEVETTHNVLVFAGRPGRLVAANDVTERKRMESAIRSSEETLARAQEIAGLGSWDWDLLTNKIHWSAEMFRIYGIAREGFGETYEAVRYFTHPDDKERVGQIIEDALRDKQPANFDYRIVRPDGTVRVANAQLQVYLDEDGRLARTAGTVQDITERNNAEQALRESEERYRELFENAKDATYVHDLSGRYTAVNRAAEKLSGHSRANLIGRRFTDFVPPEQIEVISEQLCRKLVAEGETIYETQVIGSDGRRIPVEVSSHLTYENGIASGVQGTARDITERKRAEDQLRQAKDFSDNLIQTANVIILGMDVEGNINLFNQTAERLTGYTAGELMGRNWFETLVPRDRYPHVWDALRSLVNSGMPKAFENPILTKSGEERDIMWQNNRVKVDGKVVGTISFGNDITERKRAEEALRNYPRQLIEAQETERQSIARELHDQIGQVLTAVRINLQTVWDTCATGESRALIDEGIAIVDEALQQVRDLSFELRPSLLDDLGLVAALRWYSDRFARRTGIRAATALDLPNSRTRLGLELETACFRIVQEALTNVVRHASAKKVSITLRSLNNELRLSIKDDGKGFDAHSQILSELTAQLGLRGMRERARALGGRLEIKSGPSRGTEICACFPRDSNKD